MRLRGAVLAAVLTGSVLTGVAVAPAGAATNPAITIRAIDREGKVVPVTASLQRAPGTPVWVDDTLTSAHPTRVPREKYNIAAWVQEPNGTGQTLVDREITITNSVTVTFDARKGRRILFTVNDPTVSQDFVLAEPFVPGGSWAFDSVDSANSAELTYAVPGAMAPGYDLALQADLVRPDKQPSPVEYQLLRIIKGVIPSNLTFSNDAAKLASDRVTVKEIDPGATSGVLFRPMPSDGNLSDLPALSVGQSAIPPFSTEFHFTPGYEWESQTWSGTNNLDYQPVLGVRQYAQTFDNAVFGPAPGFGPDVEGNQLLAPSGGSGLFVDPTQETNTSSGQIGSMQTQLYEGTKLIAHSAGTNGVSATISAAPHWYTMRVQASRGPGATLWRTLYLSYNFQAWANESSVISGNFWPQIVPRGLSLRNAAVHGTKTTVPIWFDNPDFTTSNPKGTISVSGVRVWASANDGKTWYALRVTHSGDRWTVVVTNPAKPGYVSLRVQGTDAAKATATETVINAYRVS